MEMADKLRQLGAGAAYEVAAPTTRGHPPTASEPGICRVAGRGGSALLRVLMTDACEHDCHFCPLRASAPRRRTAFAPTELARLFGQMHAAGKVDGLFLSSGIAGPPDATMEHMLAAVELIRRREGFDGYVHLKLLPGASDAAIEAAARLASRVSINVEVPNGAYLARLQTGKDMLRDILRPMRLLHTMERAGHLPSGLSTQYVVGAAGESDREIMSSVRWLTTELGLRRRGAAQARRGRGGPRGAIHPDRWPPPAGRRGPARAPHPPARGHARPLWGAAGAARVCVTADDAMDVTTKRYV